MIREARQFLVIGRLLAVVLVVMGVLAGPLMAAGGDCCCMKSAVKSADAGMTCCKMVEAGEGMPGKDGSDGPHKSCSGKCSQCLCCGFSGLRVIPAGGSAAMDDDVEAWMGVRAEGFAGVVVSPIADILRPPRG